LRARLTKKFPGRRCARAGVKYLEERVLLKRFGEEFVEKYGFLLGSKE
jgi:hypothetical protein